MSKRVRVVVVEDDEEIRELVRRILSDDPSIQYVKAYPTGDAFVQGFDAESTDVVIMDINMPGLNGIEATRAIRHASPHIAVLVITLLLLTFMGDALRDALDPRKADK